MTDKIQNKVNILDGKLDIDELKHRNRKLESVDKSNSVYMFSCGNVLEELYTLYDGRIDNIEFRFNREAYGDANPQYESSIQDTINDVMPSKRKYLQTKQSPIPWIESMDLYETYNEEIFRVTYFEKNDDWITVTVGFDYVLTKAFNQ